MNIRIQGAEQELEQLIQSFAKVETKDEDPLELC